MFDKVTEQDYKKAKKIVDAYHKIRNEKEEQKHLKELQNLVGKHYKFHNSYSDGQKWWLYAKATELKDDEIVIETIQKDSDGRITIDKRLTYLPSLKGSYIPISEQEYRKGIQPILKELEMFNN